MYDEQGNLTWEADLDIYGKVRNFAGNCSLSECPWRYQGQYEDSETGLYYNFHRYYDPETGNYISQDPIGLAGNNPTIYAYVKDVNRQVDIFGLDIIDDVIAETLSGKGNITSIFSIPENSVLDVGERFLGSGYKEIGQSGSGVFKNGDRIFRIDSNSLTGAHDPNVPHFHLEILQSGSEAKRVVNNHIPISCN
jgi:RHS repeat-associated protein